MSRKKPMNPGFTVMIIGLLVAISPIPLAFTLALLSGSGNMYSEGEGAGAVLWFLFFTLPVGFITFVVGIVVAAIYAGKKRGANQVEPQAPSLPND